MTRSRRSVDETFNFRGKIDEASCQTRDLIAQARHLRTVVGNPSHVYLLLVAARRIEELTDTEEFPDHLLVQDLRALAREMQL